MAKPFFTKFVIVLFSLHVYCTFAQQFMAVGIALIFSGILTAAGAFTDDPKEISYRARTDNRIDVVSQASILYFPYPCEYMGRILKETPNIKSFVGLSAKFRPES